LEWGLGGGRREEGGGREGGGNRGFVNRDEYKHEHRAGRANVGAIPLPHIIGL
jgi:hypothetical protein